MKKLFCLCGGRKFVHRCLFLLIVAVCWFVLFLLYSSQESIYQPDAGIQSKIAVDTPLDMLHVVDQGKKPPRSLMNTNRKQLSINLENDWNASSTVKSVGFNATKGASVRPSKQIQLNTEAAHLDLIPSQDTLDSLQLLQQTLLKRNKLQNIINEDKFPPLRDDSLVIVVQVHKREKYLKQLLDSLKAAKGIEDVLLVISHDYFYDDMNAVVESIDFCRVS